MREHPIRNNLAPLAVGFLVAMLLQATGGWWLNSTRGVVATLAALFVTAAATSLWASDARWRRAAALEIGTMAGMAAALFWTGPGTIWPIVLAVATGLTAAAIVAGVVAAGAFKRRR